MPLLMPRSVFSRLGLFFPLHSSFSEFRSFLFRGRGLVSTVCAALKYVSAVKTRIHKEEGANNVVTVTLSGLEMRLLSGAIDFSEG